MISFEQILILAIKVTPDKCTLYRHSILLHKNYNDERGGKDWRDLNFNQNIISRCDKFLTTELKRFKINKLAINEI